VYLLVADAAWFLFSRQPADGQFFTYQPARPDEAVLAVSAYGGNCWKLFFFDM
jgi:hypothetical protein